MRSGSQNRVSRGLTKTVVDGIEVALPQEKKFVLREAADYDADALSDKSEVEVEDEDDEETKESRSRNFEFTNNLNMMRVVRAMLFFQTIALVMDNTAISFPPVFDLFCRTPLLYTLKFYSEPFIKIIYVVQNSGIPALLRLYNYAPTDKSIPKLSYDMPFRRLFISDIIDQFSVKVDFISPQYWHAISKFSHYFMGFGFYILSYFFLLRLWEIRDYTDRKEVRKWLKMYVADGWWRRGGLHIAFSMAKACILLFILMYGMYQISQQSSIDLPGPYVFGAVFSIIVVAIFGIFLLAYFLIRSAEDTFVQYVSQNVNYTSTIILKRVIKAKVESCICLIILLYTPVLYTMIKSMMIITDWNDTVAWSHRLDHNYFAPCYFEAFPPYTKLKGSDSCPNSNTISSAEEIRNSGYYQDMIILPCDSILGTTFFILSFVTTPLFVLVFFWFLKRLIDQGQAEMKKSRWFEAVVSYCQKLQYDKEQYEADFMWYPRVLLAIHIELNNQRKYLFQALYLILYSIIALFFYLVIMCITPFILLLKPVKFFGRRILFFICNVGSDPTDTKKKKEISVDERIKRTANKIISGLNYASRAMKHRYRAFSKAITRSSPAKWSRIQIFKFKRWAQGVRHGEQRVKPGGKKPIADFRLGHGGWRDELKMVSRERELRRIDAKLNKALSVTKREFVSDHVLCITIFDRVIDSAGLIMLIVPYRWGRLWCCMLIPIEFTLYAMYAAVSNYYFPWQIRAVLVIVANFCWMLATYIIQPYSHIADRWLDWIGRWMIAYVVAGFIIFDDAATNNQRDLVEDDAGPIARIVTTINVLSNRLQGDPLHNAPLLLLDVTMTGFVILYFVNILSVVGLFTSIARKWHKLRYSMHDYVVDYIVKKVDVRALGVENMYVNLPLLQQWDDVVKEQRRYAFIPKPDIRPSSLISWKEKMFEMKWASVFNLTISNMRTSLGLSLLHIVMCAGDPEVTRWIIHYYPQLLEAEDFQRDTPVAIALKECAFHLIKFSEMNDGLLDDGTSYADDEFYSYFPEIVELRNSQRYDGEYSEDYIETYVLTANERDHLTENYTFVEAPKKKPNAYVMSLMATPSVVTNSVTDTLEGTEVENPEKKRAKKKRKDGDEEDTGKAALLKRYPEDNFYDDFEGGLASCWVLLGIDVPENNINNEKYGNDSDFEDHEADLRYGIMASADMIELTNQKVVPENHKALMGSQTDPNCRDHTAGFDLILGKKKASQMGIHDDDDDDLSSVLDDNRSLLRENNLPKNTNTVTDDLWKLCKYADIFLSDQIYLYCNNMGWDIIQYKELNKMSSKLQGLLAQQLAVCFNLNPPRGFTTFAEWTCGAAEDIQEEYTAYDANKKSILGQVASVAKTFNSILFRKKRVNGNDDIFNDRIVSYMAEVYASSRDIADMSDSELGMPARVAWRAITRAFRKKYCTYVVPSIFTAPKPIVLVKLYLMRNELDCGDAAILADVILNQQTLMFCDVSQNNIGGRGMMEICKAFKEHKSITTLKIAYNSIGPIAGKAIGSWIKTSKTLKVLDLSHNRLGALVRYTSSCVKETIVSAGRAIFMGLKFNKSLCRLDVSYNDLGPSIADVIPLAVRRHHNLYSLNVSGNNIGDAKGGPMLWALSGASGGQNKGSVVTKQSTKKQKSKVITGTPRSTGGASVKSGHASVKHGMSSSKLSDLGLAANQFTEASGSAMAALVKSNSTLTSLDISDNFFGHNAGFAISKALAEALGFYERQIDEGLRLDKIAKKEKDKKDRYERAKQERREKLGLTGGYDGMSDYDEEEDSVVDLTFPNKYKKATKMMTLNMSRIGLSAKGCEALMNAVIIPSCSLTDLDISQNPIGIATSSMGDPVSAVVAIRLALKANQTLRRFNVSNLSLTEMQVLPVLGGLSNNETIMEVFINDMQFDEPCCLQFATAVEVCTSLTRITARNCRMGPQGGHLVTDIIERCRNRLTYVDLSGNIMGANAMAPIMRGLIGADCVVEQLYLSGNELDEEGGNYIVQSLRINRSLKVLDISNNYFSPSVGLALADSVKSYISDGKIIEGTKITKILLNDNPMIGARSAKSLISAFATDWTEHIEMRNVGLSHKAAVEVSENLRRVTVGWLHLDIRDNKISRVGCNRIFWSLRQNRRLRVLKLGGNELGLKTGTDEDTLGSYGIGLVRAIKENVKIVELDLSNCGLSSGAGTNLFTALQENFTIRRLNVRGNCFDEDCHNSLEILLKDTSCLAEVNIGNNRFGANFAISLAEAIAENRSMTVLIADRCNIGIGGTSSLSAFAEGIVINHKLRYLNLDGNRLGPDWGINIALAMAKNSTISRLSLRDNRLDSRSGAALKKMYQHNNTLIDLAISCEEVGRNVYDEIRKICNRKCPVSNLDVLNVETRFDYDFNKSYFPPTPK